MGIIEKLVMTNLLFQLSFVFVICNWIFRAVRGVVTDTFDGKTWIKGAVKVLGELLMFVFLFLIREITLELRLADIPLTPLFDFVTAVLLLYYFQSTFKNVLGISGVEFAVLEEIDEALKGLLGKRNVIVVQPTEPDTTEGEG